MSIEKEYIIDFENHLKLEKGRADNTIDSSWI
jgi:hypothetical protein